MARTPSSNGPSDKDAPQETHKDTFLGGGLQFNKVGTSIPGASPVPPEEETVTVIAPAHARAQAARTAAIVIALVVLTILLLVFGSDTLSGIRHTTGRGGISPSAHPVAPPRNF